MSYIVNNGIYEPDGNYVFISKRTGIISKILILTKGDTIGNYDMLREYIAPEGKEFQKIGTDESQQKVYLKTEESILDYQLVDIEEAES